MVILTGKKELDATGRRKAEADSHSGECFAGARARRTTKSGRSYLAQGSAITTGHRRGDFHQERDEASSLPVGESVVRSGFVTQISRFLTSNNSRSGRNSPRSHLSMRTSEQRRPSSLEGAISLPLPRPFLILE